MNKEKSNLPEYDGIDENGYFSNSPEGKFRPLDISDGRLTFLRSKFRIRPKDEGGEVNYDDIQRSNGRGRNSGRYSFGNRGSR